MKGTVCKGKAAQIQEGTNIAQLAGNANLAIAQIIHSLTTAAYEQGYKAGFIDGAQHGADSISVELGFEHAVARQARKTSKVAKNND